KSLQEEGVPLVSVALCTYNGARFLSHQLNSILSQSYENLEIIIVDDCSNDETWQILQTYAAADERIKLYRNSKNEGYVANFARAIKLCTGDLIALSDQDDIWDQDKISIMSSAINDHVMVYHNSDFINEDSRRIDGYTVASRYRIYDGPSCLPFLLSNCVHGHAMMFKRKLKKYIFPFNKKFPHDWWLAYVAFNIGSVKYIDEILVHYRQHPHSITDTFGARVKKGPAGRMRLRGWQRMPLMPDLDQVKYVSEFKYNRSPELMERAYQLLSRLASGKEKLRSFWFLVKYFDLLFYIGYPSKSLFSKINLVRKICFN